MTINITHNDVAGKQLFPGDVVAITTVNYADLKLARVVGFTPMKIKVVRGRRDPEHRFPNQVVFVSRDTD